MRTIPTTHIYHFNTPNNSEKGSNGIVGGDYWFTYGSVLFLILNTQDTNVAEHKAFLEEAVNANKDSRWRIAVLHQDIYGSAQHSNEPEITNLRYTLVPYFQENDVDVVLTGHDHAYSRSYLLKDGAKTVSYTDDEFGNMLEKDMDAETEDTVFTANGNIRQDTQNPAEQQYLQYLNAVVDSGAVVSGDTDTVENPEGILYMTANSSSGSKYYDLAARKQSYIASRWQEDVPGIKNKVYTGRAIKQEITVKSPSGACLKEGVDYTVSYQNNKNTGIASLTINGIGNYEEGKTETFQIQPPKVSWKKLSAEGPGKARVKFAAAKGKPTGYQITYAKNSSFQPAKNITVKKTNCILKNLNKGKTYFVKIRAYKRSGGQIVYGRYSAKKKVALKLQKGKP